MWRIGIECKMQQIFFLWGGGYFINVKIAHVCYINFHDVRKFHKMWNIVMKYVTYWYQLFTRCEELVPIFHSVKFAKCEICGSTMLIFY